jgi:hypothetical protein
MKWSKKLCIEAITTMKSPLEQAQPGAPAKSFEDLMAEMGATGNQPPEIAV